MRSFCFSLLAAVALTLPLLSAPVNTNDPTVVAAFQNGATVINFDSLPTITPLPLNAFMEGIDVPNSAILLQQLQTPDGIGITSGGGIGGVVIDTQAPLDVAVSGSGVLGSAFNPNFSNLQSTCFGAGCFLELFFEQGVNRVGFWTAADVTILASSGDVSGVVASNTVSLETVNGTELNFVGLERASDEINFVQIFATGAPFVIDDLTYGRTDATTVIPEPSSVALVALGSALLLARARRR